MGRKISRRRFVAGSIQLAAVAPLVAIDAIDAGQRVRFSAAERRTLRAAADAIIPAAAPMPAASAIGAAGYLERMTASDAALRDLLGAGLAALNARARAAHGVAFASASAEQQTALLAQAEGAADPPGFFPALRDAVYEAYYTHPRVWKLLGYKFRSLPAPTAPLERFDDARLARVRALAPLYRKVT